MGVESVTWLGALLAGLLSFFSPCILPLVPAYLSFISGSSLEEIREGRRGEVVLRTVWHASAFVLGFSMVFVLLGATATTLGGFLLSRLRLLTKIAGIIVVMLGLHTMGLFRMPFLDYERRLGTRGRPTGLVGAFIVGVAFAFGWSPCVGPILGAILAYAATEETLTQGVWLLAWYALGLGVPFLASALAINSFFSVLGRMRRNFRTVELISGALLVAIGVAIFLGGVDRIVRLF
ncbi:MAG: cytochrome c biogenesis protein CcdA [Candidatus Latescibacterota bacterium]|nr:MAG: cytochrome c biogenesis protein CcdA [Candidatus Latescibacterota bacterium]